MAKESDLITVNGEVVKVLPADDVPGAAGRRP
jgi:hypothetical protein